jgi:very-short-patch-repair endonuclease
MTFLDPDFACPLRRKSLHGASELLFFDRGQFVIRAFHFFSIGLALSHLFTSSAAIAQASQPTRAALTCAELFQSNHGTLSSDTSSKQSALPAHGTSKDSRGAAEFPDVIPIGATRLFETHLSVSPHLAIADAPSLTWSGVVGIIGKWAQTQRSVRFESLVEPERFRSPGEWRSDARKSEVEARIQVQTKRGSGTADQPQHWMLTLTRGDVATKGLQWVYRVFVTTAPSSNECRIFADVHSFYPESFTGRRRPAPSVTSMGFVAALAEKFRVTAAGAIGDSSATASAHTAQPQNAHEELDSVIVKALQSQNAQAFMHDLERLLQGAGKDRNGRSLIHLSNVHLDALNKAAPLIQAGINQPSPHDVLRFTLALESVGYEFRRQHTTNLEARLYGIGLNSMDFAAIERILDLNTLVAKNELPGHRDPLSRAMSPKFLMDIEDHIYRRFGRMPDDQKHNEVVQFFRMMSKVSRLVRDRHSVIGNRQELSNYAALLIPHLNPELFAYLAHVLWDYKILLNRTAEQDLFTMIAGWIKPGSAVNLDSDALIAFVKTLDRPSRNFINRLSDYFMTKLRTGDHEKAATFLWAIWLLDPGKAVSFAQELDSARMADLAFKVDRAQQLLTVKIYFQQVLRVNVPWLSKWLSKKEIKSHTTVSRTQSEMRDLLALLFPHKTFRLEHFVEDGGIDLDIYEPSERLDIEVDGPLHYLVDAAGRTRLLSASFRRDELVRALGFDVLRIDFADWNVLLGRTQHDVRQVVTREKPVKQALLELLKTGASSRNSLER